MKAYPRLAKAYIAAVLLLGGVVSAWELSRLTGEMSWLWLPCAVVAATAQVLKVEGPTRQTSYNISWMVYGFAFVLLGTPATLAIMVSAHAVEWLWHRYRWYVQCFNIATYALTILSAGLIFAAINKEGGHFDIASVIGVLVAMAAFTVVNHLLVGVVIWLSRGETFAQSGVFGFLTLMIDFSLLCLGAAAGLVWMLNPFAAVLTLTPIYLIYSTLKVPALQRQTEIDPKTGLFNSNHLKTALAQELARADRFDRPLTVVMADLDLLRNINNTYGHLAGDVVLIGVAQILKKSVRDYDVVARFGGEEFCVLMPETSPQTARNRIDGIRMAIEAAEFDVATSVHPIKVTMSFGIAGREKFGQSTEDLVHAADLAVYQSKLRGRNCVTTVFGENGGSPAHRPRPETAEQPAAAAPQEVEAGPGSASAPAAATAGAAGQGPEAAPPIRVRPAWLVHAYVAGVVVVALGLWQLVAGTAAVSDWVGLTLFALVALLTEWLALEIYARDTSVSTTAVPFIAGVLLFGPMGTLALSLTVAAVAKFRHRSSFSRFAFNFANHMISGLLAVGVIQLVGGPIVSWPLPIQVVLALLVAGIMYLSSTSLIAGAVATDSGRPMRQVWSERFRWLAPYYLAMGVVAAALIVSYRSAGLEGLLAVVVLLLTLRIAQKQYIDHTKDMVSQLRAANSELRQRTGEITTLNEELLLALSNAIDLRDPDVMGHSQNVARYAILIAHELGLPPERVELVRRAGLLHDIGKLGIADAILLKPARLNEAEFEIIKQHTQLGEDIVQPCHSLRALAPFIKHHHERFDGTGYPDGLRGHAIPLEARILNLADSIEAMATDRPYRRSKDSQAILDEIRACAGTQFDPAVASAFIQVVQREGHAAVIDASRNAKRGGDGSAAGLRSLQTILKLPPPIAALFQPENPQPRLRGPARNNYM